MMLLPMSMTLNTTQGAGNLPKSNGHKIALAISTSTGCISLVIFGLALLWWRRRHNREPSLMSKIFNCFRYQFCLYFEAFHLGVAPLYMAFLCFMGDENDANKFNYNLEVEKHLIQK